jgi:hypothetical protein
MIDVRAQFSNKTIIARVAKKLASRPFPIGRDINILVLSENNEISKSQIFPFYFYAEEMSRRWSYSLREVDTNEFEMDEKIAPLGATLIFIQAWFDLTAARSHNIFEKINKRYPGAISIFFDSFAPTDLRLAEMLDENISIYFKKNIFKNRDRYMMGTCGDTFLDQYYGARYGIKQELTNLKIPSYFLDKIILSPGFFTAQRMLPSFYFNSSHLGLPKRTDVHARLASKGDGWYGMMRREASKSLNSLGQYSITQGPGIPLRKYMKEMRESRICFSPFGFGEVCWRDFEAVLCGSLLVKPDMAHIETQPDIFIPYETYIPVSWDFSDVAEKIEYYLFNEAERKKIVDRAYHVLRKYVVGDGFCDQIAPLMSH